MTQLTGPGLHPHGVHDDRALASAAAPGHPRRWHVLAVMCLSLTVITIDTTILNVALPSIQRSLDPSAGQLQWIVDAYTVVFAGLLLTAGTIGDRFGRRGALAAGLVIFAAASVASALSSGPGQLVAWRAVVTDPVGVKSRSR